MFEFEIKLDTFFDDSIFNIVFVILILNLFEVK